MKKKSIMVDMDDVITGGTFSKMIETFLGHPIDLSKTGFYIQNALEDRKEEFFRDVFPYQNLYENAELFEGCYDVLKALNEEYKIYIVTTYVWRDSIEGTANILKNKFNYLIEKLPFLDPDRFIFITEKNLLYFDIKIDDKLGNLENSSTKILFDAYHNQDYTESYLKEQNTVRVTSWKEIYELLKKA